MFPGDPRKTVETHMEVGKEKKRWIADRECIESLQSWNPVSVVLSPRSLIMRLGRPGSPKGPPGLKARDIPGRGGADWCSVRKVDIRRFFPSSC